MEPVTVNLTTEQREAAKRIQHQRNLDSFSEYIRQLVEADIAKEERKRARQGGTNG